MPYKEKGKNPAKNPRPKTSYKVTNWSSYNQSLKNRGSISLYFPKGDLISQFIDECPYVEGMSGQQPTYQQSYIELMYIMYRLFAWGMRQICGYFEDLWETKDLKICVPSFGHLSDLFAKVPLKIKQYCNKLSKKIAQGETIEVIAYSTGLKSRISKEWLEEKYGKSFKNKPWSKLHISMDADFNIHAAKVTDHLTSDISMIEELIPKSLCANKFIADGAYYSIEKAEELYIRGITPVIPPPSNAVIHGKETTTWHDKVVKYVEEKKTIYAFHKKYGYGIRSRVESQISRIKRCIGPSLKTQREESREREGIIITNIINIWNSFGRCESVKMG